MQVLGIVGSPSTPSRTRCAVEAALSGAARREDVDTEVLQTASIDLEIADGRRLEAYNRDTRTAVNRIIAADAYLVGTPIYRAAYSGALKNLLDLVPRGRWQADEAPLENAAVGLIGTGATAAHFLAVDTALRPALAFFGAHTVGGRAYLTEADFSKVDGGYEVANETDEVRLRRLGQATVDLAEAITSSDALAGLGPQL